MGLSSSLSASVMGLNTNAQRLSGISDNIANSSTYGYKRAETDFTSLVNAGNSNGSYDAGGVQASTKRDVYSQGSLTVTSNSTDLAMQGDGFIPLTTTAERDSAADSRPFMLATTGSFTEDDEGYLVTDTGLQLLGWPTDESGDVGIVSREAATSLEPVNLSGFDFTANATSEIDLSVNLPAEADVGDEYSLTVEYFDELGESYTLTMDYTLDTVNADSKDWTLSVTDSFDGTVVGDYALTFSSISDDSTTPAKVAGSLEAVVANSGTYDTDTGSAGVTTGPGDLAIDLTIGTYGSTTNTTQFVSEFAVLSINKNGSSVGFLESIEMDDDGFIQGIYDTGLRRPLYQIPIANIPDPGNLDAESNQTFSITNDSGDFYLWDANSGPVGSVEGYALQESTTDITEELTQLIETQRAYSSNAKIVQTVDEMLQETTNLKR